MPSKVVNHYNQLDLWTKRSWVLFVFFLLTFFAFTLGNGFMNHAQAQQAVPVELKSGSLSLLPYVQALVDDTGLMQIGQIQSENTQKRFAPFDFKKIRQEQGVLWLRLHFAPSGNVDAINPARTLLLDLGQDVGASPKLFVLEKDSVTEQTQWQEYKPSQGSVFLLPQVGDVPSNIYIRLDGIPGIWFAPYLRTPHNIASSYELFATPAAIVALCVVMLLCLLRGFTERGQWRYWAALYTAVVLYYALYGVPISGLSYVPMEHMLRAMAPGVALILFAHVGRHVLSAAQSSRGFGVQFMLLTLVGVVVALLPLVPGFAWTVRYFNLWPILMLLFVPTAIGAWMGGIAGAKRYILSCLVPPLGVAVALLGLYEPAHFEEMAIIPASMLSAIPLCGLALGALMLAGTASIGPVPVHSEESSYEPMEESINDLVQQDPNLRLVPAGEAQSEGEEGSGDIDAEVKKLVAELEEQLRWPVEQLLREVAALEAHDLSAEARENAISIVGSARDICNIVNASAKNRRSIPALGGTEERVFDLQGLLRQAHDSVAPTADKKNIALSWFMQPDLPPSYKGDAVQLLLVLRLLLESAVRSTHRGAVYLNVRRVPESVNAGHLLFTVTDSGTGKPPHDRSVTALARAWELSAAYRGFLGVESNALGASISFTAHLQVCASGEKADEPTVKQPRPIILFSDNIEERQLWGFFLEKMPRVLEARSGEELLEFFDENFANLIVFDARMPLGHIYGAFHGLWQICEARGENFPTCMAIYMDRDMEQPLLDMGFSYVFAMPVTRQGLFDAVQDILGRQTDDVADKDMLQEQGTPVSQETQITEEAHKTEPQKDSEEVVDTGEPILSMAPSTLSETTTTKSPKDTPIVAPKATAKRSQLAESLGFGSLSQTLSFEPDLQSKRKEDVTAATPVATVPNEQGGTQSSDASSDVSGDVSDAPLDASVAPPSFVWNSEKYVAENSLFKNFTPPDDEIGRSERPTPSQDKSNAAYLTSFVTTDAPSQSSEPEPKSQQEAQVQTEPQAPPAEAAPASEKTKLKMQLRSQTMRKKKIEPQDATKTIVSADTAQSPTQAKPQKTSLRISKSKVGAKAEESPIKTLPEQKTRQSQTVQVVSPAKKNTATLTMPKKATNASVQGQDATEKNISTAKPAVEKTPAPAQGKSTTSGMLQLKKIKPAPSSVAVATPNPPESIIEQQGKLDLSPTTQDKESSKNPEVSSKKSIKDSLVNLVMPKKKKESALEMPVQEPLTSKETAMEWVGEPTPIVKDTGPQSLSMAGSQDTTVKIGTTGNISQSTNTTEADERGREELRYLRSYLDSSHALENTQEPIPVAAPLKQAQASTATVAEPSPIPSAYKGNGGVSSQNYNYTIATEPLQEHTELSPIEKLLMNLDSWLAEAKSAFAIGDASSVERAVQNMASSADSFGLRTLARLARTVEAAARAEDIPALGDLLPELDNSVQRNRAALKM